MTGSVKKSINLIKNLGYTFVNNNLLTLALTHSSYQKVTNNQRLEFLGDAILNMVIAEYLYQHYPNATEGELTRIRSNLVKEETLSLIAKNHDLQKYIILGFGELKTGGHHKNSILADTLEAIIAAIYLDSDLLTIKNLIISWYSSAHYLSVNNNSNVQPLSSPTLLSGSSAIKDAKTILQELLHAKGLALPIYKIIKITGKPHHQTFQVSCKVVELTEEIYASGASRKKAEQAAAHKILKLLT